MNLDLVRVFKANVFFPLSWFQLSSWSWKLTLWVFLLWAAPLELSLPELVVDWRLGRHPILRCYDWFWYMCGWTVSGSSSTLSLLWWRQCYLLSPHFFMKMLKYRLFGSGGQFFYCLPWLRRVYVFFMSRNSWSLCCSPFPAHFSL